MATASTPYSPGTGHTAGIYADLSVDGPVIGTLVAVVDRAKNLPNRKIIGKQDPYCAARLGKEAKKTTTDIRGGQTPKWDQELRFTVHDSSDYLQLKISVFTDDKKTDLVGEAWIDLKSIVVPGGGQADVWQSLSCKGKYAGEIRLEITFYDSRPKPEKPKPRQHSATDMGTSRHRTSPTKRRPLPSDPITGEASSTTAPIPATTMSPSPYELHGPLETPSRHIKQSSHSAKISNQSPLQQPMEHNTPQGARHQSIDGHSSSSGTPAALSYSKTPSRQPRRSRDHHDPPPRHSDGPVYDFQDASSQHAQSDRHELHMGDSHLPLLDANPTPPPPPAHRSHPSSVGAESPQISPTKAVPSTPMRRDVLKSEAHRHSASISPARLPFSHHDAPSSHSPISYGTPSPRHHSHDATYGHRSLQPTVEDAPDSPPRFPYRQRHASEPTDERGPSPGYQRSPAPASPGYHNQSPRFNPQHYDDQVFNHGHHASPFAMPDRGYGGGSSNSTPQHRQAKQGREYDSAQSHRALTYDMPSLPLSLQHAVDPVLARDVSERINDERNYDARPMSQHNSPARDRQRSVPLPGYNASPRDYALQSRELHKSNVTYSGGPQEVLASHGHDRKMSASSGHNIPRKSVSPAPHADEVGRLPDIPFGPDSYDALNPSMITSQSPDFSLSGQEPTDPDAKIIMYDGREVDPSDHLPMESWAPEPEPKSNQMAPSPDHARWGPQPMPPSGHRTMRLSRVEAASMVPFGQQDQSYSRHAVSARNRLQKKTPRASVSPTRSSPLVPIHAENYQGKQGAYGSHDCLELVHRGSFDYSSENSAPQYEARPPVPAKMMGGANGGATELSLMEEMLRIDIGHGRSRRRGGY